MFLLCAPFFIVLLSAALKIFNESVYRKFFVFREISADVYPKAGGNFIFFKVLLYARVTALVMI